MVDGGRPIARSWLALPDRDNRHTAFFSATVAPTDRRRGVGTGLLRTAVDRDAPRLATLTGVYRGADCHERETYEMFGVVFDGHPDLRPLLLPDGFEGHPLRKDFLLASRLDRPWPGAKEPGESDSTVGAAAPSRRRMRPPGVPAPEERGGPRG